MKSPLRHPLVAFLLLALVAAMLVPLWQREPATTIQPLDMELPPVPLMEPADPTEPVSEQELRAADAEINAGRDALVRQADAGDGVQAALPGAWAVQLQSYPSEQLARAEKQRLLDAGHRAFLRRSIDGQLWQLYAGPELEQEAAEATLARLQFEMLAPDDARVVPFRP